jgi:uncharacterized protein (DUF362 family)/Pyruvate/2-oxoacid:ferredoxin oxidoreductase delta subunit
MSIVSLIRCETYDRLLVERSVRKALDPFGGMAAFVKPGDRVLIKPNLLSARSPEKRITTDPEVVRAVAILVAQAGGKAFIGDSPAIEPFRRVAFKTGMEEVAREVGVDLLELTQPTRVRAPEGTVFKNLELAFQVLDADVVINLPKLKTHSQMLLTLGVKNLFGTVVAQRKAEWHFMAGVDRDVFASLLLDIYQVVKPALTILDGVWGMEGHGPSNGSPRAFGLIAAAEDAVALDVGICRLLRVPLETFPVYRSAKMRGIGETDPSRIAFEGDAAESFRNGGIQVPRLDSLGLLPSVFDRLTKRYLVSKPVQEMEACAGCGQCAEICPAGAIGLRSRKAAFDYDLCIRCYCCQEICPQNAIHFKKGLLVRLLNRLKR